MPSTPPSRLNEIAQRRLHALGIPTRPGADGLTLEGELVGAIRNPLLGQPIERVRFVVEGHDKLRPVAPPALEGLPAVSFFELQRPEPLLTALEGQLAKRLAAAQRAINQMRRLRLAPNLDAQRGRAVATLELTPLGTVTLEADERGVRTTQIAPAMSTRPAVALHQPLELEEFEHRVDLELLLFAPAERALQQPAVPAPTPTPTPSPQAERTPGPAATGGVTLGQLVEKFGAEARVGAGLVVARELTLGDRQVRFVARWDPNRGFLGRITGHGATLWEDTFDLGRLQRVEELVAEKLGVQAPPREPSAATPFTLGPAGALDASLVAGQMLPVAGEVWVMSILVEAEGAEIRYVPVDIDGKPFGTARTLARSDFLATFESAGAVGYRLAAKVLQVEGSHVTWVQLDPGRRPVGKPKSGALGMFVHHFVPEAAAY